MGDYHSALKYYSRAVSLREKIFGKNHPVVLESYLLLAEIYEKLGARRKAEIYRKLASGY